MVNAPYAISGRVRKDNSYDLIIQDGVINALGGETQNLDLGEGITSATSQLVTFKHTTTSEELTATTDSNGLYTLDLANMTNTYVIGDAYTLTVENIPATTETVEDYHYGSKSRKVISVNPTGDVYRNEYPMPMKVVRPIQTTESYLIEQGKVFVASVSFDAVADTAIGQIVIQTPQNVEVQMGFTGICDGLADVFLYEGATVSVNGTVVPAVCLNRLNAGTAQTAVTHTPTVTTTGTALQTGRIAAGEGKIILGNGNKFILKQNSKYLFRITNNAGGAKDMNIAVHFQEL